MIYFLYTFIHIIIFFFHWLFIKVFGCIVTQTAKIHKLKVGSVFRPNFRVPTVRGGGTGVAGRRRQEWLQRNPATSQDPPQPRPTQGRLTNAYFTSHLFYLLKLSILLIDTPPFILSLSFLPPTSLILQSSTISLSYNEPPFLYAISSSHCSTFFCQLPPYYPLPPNFPFPLLHSSSMSPSALTSPLLWFIFLILPTVFVSHR